MCLTLITSNVNQTHLCRLRFLTNSHNASEPSPIKNRQLQTSDWTRACVVNLASGVFLALQLLIGGTDVTVILLAQTIWGKKDHPTTRLCNREKGPVYVSVWVTLHKIFKKQAIFCRWCQNEFVISEKSCIHVGLVIFEQGPQKDPRGLTRFP